MALLHGIWLLQPPQQPTTETAAPTSQPDRNSPDRPSALGTGGLFLWGEVWRRLTADMVVSLHSPPPIAAPHPFAISQTELLGFLEELQQSGQLRVPIGLVDLVPETRSQERTTDRGRSRKGTAVEPPDLAAAAPQVVTTKVTPKNGVAARSSPAVCWQRVTIALPSHLERDPEVGTPEAEAWEAIVPQHSAADPPPAGFLHPWQVEGLWLPAAAAIATLHSLPLDTRDTEESFLSADLRFWSHAARWSLDLLARSKFLPGCQRDNGTAQAVWQPLLDSGIDQIRWQKFAESMPGACRIIAPPENADRPPEPSNPKLNPEATQNSSLTIPLPIAAETLLHTFLEQAIDAQVRQVAQRLPLETPGGREKSHLSIESREWLQALGRDARAIGLDTSESLATALATWVAPLQQSTAPTRFRTCLHLHPPPPGQTTWQLEYGLQAPDDPAFLVSATTIWNSPVDRLQYRGRPIDHPQETFLMGLGLASRLYGLIEPSLQEPRPQFCTLTAMQAYEFLKSIVWRLQDSGLGVVLPPSLANQEGWANRLGLKIQAQTGKLKKGQRLGLQSLLNFRWELSIGGQTLTKEQFDRLVALNTPLVEVNGEWVELRPADIRAAQTFFASRKDQTALSLEDALRISTGDTQMIEKLPVVSFEAAGALEELINTLNGRQTVASLPEPAGFRGELRPYQARGVGWLAFLEQWGLGACLADDMGLGKCVAKDTALYVNGTLQPAELLWQTQAIAPEFDGEGFWATPAQPLIVNAIDERSGKIILAPIRRLYRQRVRETLRKITLQDGSTITLTQRHKLLTDRGWTTDLQVGSYVCVPSHLVWHGQPVDADLVKFLAWQIAEGHEPGTHGTFNITQNDRAVLDDLCATLQRIGQRDDLKINQPGIQVIAGKVPSLRINSVAYRQFLEAKGYAWGRRSAEKTIPAFVMQADLSTARIFLQHYFEAEASVIHSMRSVEISSASGQLMQQLSVLLRRFGIWLRISQNQKRATNGSGIYRPYWIGTIGGTSLRQFLQAIGFVGDRKQRKLEAICHYPSNTNVEGIPAVDVVAQLVQSTRLPLRHFGMHNTVYINGSQQFSRSSLERVVASCDRILSGEAEQTYRQQPLSRWTAQTLEAYRQLDSTFVSQSQQLLRQRLHQEVFYCRIEAIEDIDYDDWVYDFEVAEHHNFVANQILCHNTVQLIAFLLHLKEQNTLEAPTLLVCPTSVLGNWEREVKKFGPTLRSLLHHGDNRAKGKALAKAVAEKDLVITSYALVQRDLKDLQTVDWQGVVLDEAQNVKNPEAKQSQAVRQLDAQFRIALTGTPVENRLAELWSILDFLNPGYLGPKNFFQRRFATPIERYGDTASLQTLRSLVQPFILRRLKTDRDIIQDLPEKQEMTVFCGLTSEQAGLYQQLVEKSLEDIEAAEGIQRKGIILALLVKLKQICNHPELFLKEGSESATQNSKLKTQNSFDSRSGKLQRLEEMLEEVVLEGDRALIFTQFAEWGKLLKAHLEKQLGRETLFLYGSTPKKQREEMVDRFQHDPQGPRIFILSLKAGGVGLNLTRANHVFHFDRWWNPAVENQATDRVFRIGQTRNVQVHKFVCNGTLEEKIHDLIESKKALAEQVVGTGENWLTELNTDQLRNLLLLDRNAIIGEE